MTTKHQFLAMDFGAESGRGVVVTLAGGRVEMEEVHRFANRPVLLNGTLFWDFPFLFAETLASLKLCAEKGMELDGVGVDTWGVDFGLLGEDGQLLAGPVHYRDVRTEGIHDFTNPTMTTEEIFEATSYEPWAISSLFQLMAMRRQNSPVLPLAKTFLMMPDLFNYFLTGIRACERSIASNANLMGTDGQWCREVIERFELPEFFVDLVEPGVVLGPLQESVRKQTGLGEVPVIATCCHDTAAVAAAVPVAEGEKNWAFLSSGTWSILGKLQDAPITSPEAFRSGFSNEYTLGGWFLCRNILGLWLVQELKRKWDVSTDPWDYDRMTAEAATAPAGGAIVDVSDRALLAPPDMEEALLDLAERLGQPKPATRGALVRCVLESLALEYAYRLKMIGELTGEPCEALYLVGGGIANKLLCQLTADACGLSVQAGADQCTALGNGLTQAVALDVLEGPDEIRKIMRNSVEITTYAPRDAEAWQAKRQAYAELVERVK